eukprot:351491-Chlamydomonas_euryale.AAC.21
MPASKILEVNCTHGHAMDVLDINRHTRPLSSEQAQTRFYPKEGRPLTSGSLRYVATQLLISLRRSLTASSMESSPRGMARTVFTLPRTASCETSQRHWPRQAQERRACVQNGEQRRAIADWLAALAGYGCRGACQQSCSRTSIQAARLTRSGCGHLTHRLRLILGLRCLAVVAKAQERACGSNLAECNSAREDCAHRLTPAGLILVRLRMWPSRTD